jgi:nitroimidazol reductase NimA-like FMN-containing flavoprotein (pyridoxamine 5'-phosphate oxidase superfamily)
MARNPEREAALPDTQGSNLECLTRTECLELLGSCSVGRVAVAVPGGAPLVVPVNYVLDGEVVVFRTGEGSKLDALRQHGASFQVDCIDPFHRTGWSVLIQGFAYETSPADVDVQPWADGAKSHWVRIFAGSITGRQLRLPEIKLDDRGYL